MMERGGSRYYYGFDVPGNVLGLFDGSGLVNKYTHTAFGKPDTVSHSVANPYRYMSRRYDDESGLYFMRARYYDPDMARFVSEDPIGLMGGINTYAFAGNDPANSRDPMGLCEEKEPDYLCFFLDGLTVTVERDAQGPFMSDEEWDNYVEQLFGGIIQGVKLAGVFPTLGGGSGGGGGSTQLCPGCRRPSPFEWQMMTMAVESVCIDYRNTVAGTLVGGQWMIGPGDPESRNAGAHYSGYRPGRRLHYIIYADHPGFRRGDLASIGRTFVHEYLHHQRPFPLGRPGYEAHHARIYDEAGSCAGLPY